MKLLFNISALLIVIVASIQLVSSNPTPNALTLSQEEIDKCIEVAEPKMSKIYLDKIISDSYEKGISNFGKLVKKCRDFADKVYFAGVENSCKHDMLRLTDEHTKAHPTFTKYWNLRKFCNKQLDSPEGRKIEHPYPSNPFELINMIGKI